METTDKIDVGIFKVVIKAIAESDNVDIMANTITQLMVGALDIKGCTMFALNPGSHELEALASFGMSTDYLSKGPVLSESSIATTLEGEPVIIRDTTDTDQLQYPENAREEGIGAIISIPIKYSDKLIGEMRLYHSAAWDISEEDVESLMLLAENIGLAMMYFRLQNAVDAIKEVTNEVHYL